MDDVVEVSSEARDRLNSARHRDLAFAVKRKIGDRFSSEDVEMIVELLVKAAVEKRTVSKEFLVEELRKHNRSPQKCEDLATALVR